MIVSPVLMDSVSMFSQSSIRVITMTVIRFNVLLQNYAPYFPAMIVVPR